MNKNNNETNKKTKNLDGFLGERRRQYNVVDSSVSEVKHYLPID